MHFPTHDLVEFLYPFRQVVQGRKLSLVIGQPVRRPASSSFAASISTSCFRIPSSTLSGVTLPAFATASRLSFSRSSRLPVPSSCQVPACASLSPPSTHVQRCIERRQDSGTLALCCLAPWHPACPEARANCLCRRCGHGCYCSCKRTWPACRVRFLLPFRLGTVSD
jgi:hypothetical protein